MHHPHHVIPKIFALANAFMDEKIVGSTLKAVSTSPRTNTAKALLDVFKTEDKLRPIVDQWDIMSTGEYKLFSSQAKNQKYTRNFSDRVSL